MVTNYRIRVTDLFVSGGLAQPGERLICIQEVAGSIPVSSTNFNKGKLMKTIFLILATAVLVAGCSIVPKDPRMSLGKKCNVDDDGTTVSSYVWIYGKEGGLSASKEMCEKN